MRPDKPLSVLCGTDCCRSACLDRGEYYGLDLGDGRDTDEAASTHPYSSITINVSVVNLLNISQ